MNKFLFTGIFFLVSNLVFSQIDSTSIGTESSLLSDTIKKSEFYEISINRESNKNKPSPAEHKPIEMIEARTFVLINGLKVILVENNILPFTSYKLFFDYSSILLNDKKGVDLVFNKLWGKNGRKNKEKDVIEYKSRTGTKINVDKKSIYIEGLSRYKTKNLELLSDLAMKFSFTQKEFEDTKSRVIDSLYFASNKNEFIVDAVARKLMFGLNNPVGESFNIDEIDSLKSKDIIDYHSAFFNPNNSYLMVYGNISMSELKRTVKKYFNNHRKGDIIKGYYPQPYNLPQVEIDFIENYNSDSLSVWMGNVKRTSDIDGNWLFERSNNTLLLDNDIGLFSTKFIDKYGITNLSIENEYEKKYFCLKYDISENDIAESIIKSIGQLEKIDRDEPIDSANFNIYKKQVVENYVQGFRNPEKISDLYLKYYITGFGKYMVPNLMEILDTISISRINQSLKQQVNYKKIRVVVSGKPGIAVPHLEKLGYKINYFDQFANTTFPPALDRAVPDSISVNDVISKHILARGGEKKLKSVKKLLQWWELDINNTKLYVKNKYMLPNKRLSTYSNKEVIVLKTMFNGEYGYVEQSGDITEIEGENFLKLSMEKSIFPLMYYQDLGYSLTLESQIPLKGEECYKVISEAPYGQQLLLYFRISDGLLIREEVIDYGTGDVINYTNYYDFKTYDDIIFPYRTETLIGGKKTMLTLTQIKINDENVRKKNFK